MSTILESLEGVPVKTAPQAAKAARVRNPSQPESSSRSWQPWFWLGLGAMALGFVAFAFFARAQVRALKALMVSQREIMTARLDLLTERIDETNRAGDLLRVKTQSVIGRLDHLEEGFVEQRKFFEAALEKQSALLNQQRDDFERELEKRFDTLWRHLGALQNPTGGNAEPSVSSSAVPGPSGEISSR